jgi:hypothetical protein
MAIALNETPSSKLRRANPSAWINPWHTLPQQDLTMKGVPYQLSASAGSLGIASQALPTKLTNQGGIGKIVPTTAGRSYGDLMEANFETKSAMAVAVANRTATYLAGVRSEHAGLTEQVRISSHTVPFESKYAKLGCFRGASGSPEGKKASREFWIRQGEPGGRWLIARLAQESNLEVLDGAAAVLRRMDAFVVPLIAESLKGDPEPEVAECLLHALRRDNLSTETGALYTHVLNIIERYFLHGAEEVRQAAYETAAVLAQEDSRRLLETARLRENDPELLRVIEEVQQHIR